MATPTFCATVEQLEYSLTGL